MKEFRAAAPAKLILAGEYVVLRGGAALSAAVDVRAHARLETGVATSSLTVRGRESSFGFAITGGGDVQWTRDPGHNGALLTAAVGVFARQGSGLQALEPFAVELDSSAFYSGTGAARVKRGLGSSAAVAVALTACLQQALGQEPTLQMCLDVHHAFQNQRGSGMDVCSSFHGGVIARGAAGITQLPWPVELTVLPVWTGVPASTPAMLARMEAFQAAAAQDFAEHMEILRAASAAVLGSWRDAGVQSVLDSVDAFAVALRNFDEAAGIGIWSAPHLQLANLAEDFGLVYKPSGAGGGDFGLVFGADTERLDDFRLHAERAGFLLPAMDLGAAGLQTGRPNDR